MQQSIRRIMLILILMLFTCYAHAMNNETSAQDLEEWMAVLKPAPLSQNASTSAPLATPLLPRKRSIQETSENTSTQKKERLKKLLLQMVRCPLYAKGCSWVCVHGKPTTQATQRIIQDDCVKKLREHWMQTHFSVEEVTRYIDNEMEKETKVNLDDCSTDNLDMLTKSFIGTNEGRSWY